MQEISKKEFNKRYEKIKKLGKGGSAVVYKVKDVVNDKIKVDKIISDKAVKTLGFNGVKQFILKDFDIVKKARENKKLKKYIPKYYDIYLIKEKKDYEFHIIMEYVTGYDLTMFNKCIKETGYQPTIYEKYLFIEKMLKIFSELHSIGIVHRDVKPENIMLSKKGLKLIDFGLACKKTDCHKNIYGTEFYDPPVILSKVTFKQAAATEIWVLGIVFLEFFSNKLLNEKFVNLDQSQLEILYDAAKPFDKIIKTMTDRDLEKRPTAQELLDMLHKLKIKKHDLNIIEIKK